jgi:hypothetical protein
VSATETETLSTAAERLAERVISDTAEQRQLHPERRPTWAPPLPFPPELVSDLERLKALLPDADFDPAYGRLWAEWADPKRCDGRFDGFSLRAGKSHDGERILRLSPGVGAWHVGPHWLAPKAPKPVKPLQAYKIPKGFFKGFNPEDPSVKEMVAFIVGGWPEQFAEAQSRYAKEQAKFEPLQAQFLLREDLRNLGVAAFLAFAGAPDATMRSGAILAGICFRCGKILTDTTSRELGIGPECRRPFSAPVLKAWHQSITQARQ